MYEKLITAPTHLLAQVGAMHGSSRANYDVVQHHEVGFEHLVPRDSKNLLLSNAEGTTVL